MGEDFGPPVLSNGSAIGHRFALGETPEHPGEIEVIGVVKDAKYTSLSEGTVMAAYFPCTQNVGFHGNFAVRYAPGANRQEIISRVRHSIAEINPSILVDSVSSLEEDVDRSIATQSLIARLFSSSESWLSSSPALVSTACFPIRWRVEPASWGFASPLGRNRTHYCG